jgi:uncharacterized protein
MIQLTQLQRLFVAALEIAFLLVIQKLAFNTWIPDPGPGGLWLYAALLNVILASRLVTPFYEKPVDVVSYALAALLVIWMGGGQAQTDQTVAIALGITSAILLISFAAAILAMIGLGAKWPKVSAISKLIAERLGSARIAFSLVLLFAVFSYHRNAPIEVIWIAIAWALTVAFKPIEHIFILWERVLRIFRETENAEYFGSIRAYQSPNLLLIEQDPAGDGKAGPFFGFKDPHRGHKYAFFLDYVGREERILVRAIELDCRSENVWVDKVLLRQPANSVVLLPAADLSAKSGPSKAILDGNKLVGIVAQDSSIDKIYFEVIENSDLEEGRLVETYINDVPVIYQIVDGLTKEEIVYQKNTFGFARAQAQKIGAWNSGKRKFDLIKWLPLLNTPVFLKKASEPSKSPDSIGHFPKTEYTVQLKNIHELVTHNTAILGILGVGKSMLSIELVERMMASGIKVICLDLTNQYVKELREFYDEKYEADCIQSIRNAGEKDRDLWAENPQEGGSLPNLRDAIFTDLKEFIDSKNPRMLKIYNPGEFSATKQLFEPKSFNTGKAWERGAALWQVTPVEITQIISEAALVILQDKMSDVARVCLVYEEAHSLVPEWNSVVAEGDKAATNGSARAILQGRKYGLGCLLVTQRTANVTKTILNQCNSVFAMRTFDSTGTEFLSNYIGKDYASVLSSIPERHAVFFGKASSCENPVLIRLNDRDIFLRAFREKHPVAKIDDRGAAAIHDPALKSVKVQKDDFDDDIPF